MSDWIDEAKRQIAAEAEGGLFVHVWVVHLGKSLYVHRDKYTVINGIVYEVRDTISPTEDEPHKLPNEAIRIGKYDPNKKYKYTKPVEMTLPQLNKLLKSIPQPEQGR